MPKNPQEVTAEQVKAFQQLYAGASQRSYISGDALITTVKHRAGSFEYMAHLGGESCLGLVPVNEKGECSWAADDVDGTVDLAALAREVARRKMPLRVFRSKSGGAHLVLFLKDPLPAAPVRATLRAYAKALGLPEATEIFPKQDGLGDDPKKGDAYYGNAIRLPYFAGDRSTRYALGPDGRALSLAEFLAQVERVDAARLDDVDLAPAPQPEPAPAKEATKVIATAEGPVIVGPNGRPVATIPKDYRNPTLFHYGLRLIKLGYPFDAVRAALEVMNRQLCDPPLDPKELESTIFKTLPRKAATQPPIKAVAPLRFLNLSEFLAHQPKDDEPAMIAGLLPEGGWVTLVSRPKIGKSHTIQQIAFEAAMGKPVFGSFKVREGIRAAYCDFEQGRGETLYRTQAMINGYPEATGDGYFTMTKSDIHEARAFAYEISEPGNARRSEFADLLIDRKVNLLCLAALRSVVKLGGNLKDQEIAEAINEWVTWLQATANISIIVAHHSRKGFGGSTEQESFGSTMLSAAPDAMFILKREGTFNRFITTEVRFDAAPSFVLGLCPAGRGRLLRVIEDPDSVLTKHIMELHDKGLPTRAIASTPGINLSHNAVAERIRDEEAARKAKTDHEAVIHQEAVRREQELVLV